MLVIAYGVFSGVFDRPMFVAVWDFARIETTFYAD